MKMTEEMAVATRYQSHLPALLACVAESQGPVLEIGVGYFSTPHLHALCDVLNRLCYSVETDKEWYDGFSVKYQGRNHAFVRELGSLPIWSWGVTFIDHSPGGENRASALRQFIDRSQFVIVHDYEKDNLEAIAPLLTGCHYHVCTHCLPPTLVASKTRYVPRVLTEM